MKAYRVPNSATCGQETPGESRLLGANVECQSGLSPENSGLVTMALWDVLGTDHLRLEMTPHEARVMGVALCVQADIADPDHDMNAVPEPSS